MHTSKRKARSSTVDIYFILSGALPTGATGILITNTYTSSRYVLEVGVLNKLYRWGAFYGCTRRARLVMVVIVYTYLSEFRSSI